VRDLLKTNKFSDEAEEAEWWANKQDSLASEFEKAAAEGALSRGTVVRKGNTPTTTIRLDPDDIAKARVHAEQKGLRYQTYLKMLIHEALRQEELRASGK
jgi:predicted DNA binding CopG/RHH family protein